jgi:DNA-binding NtrC family response regulator
MAGPSAPDILLVEDTPSLARVYLEYLKKTSFSAEVAETGAAALSALTRRPPRLVLLDLNLPDMNGIDILRRIKGEGWPMAVVVITANGSIGLAVEAMRAGAHDFIVKPFAAERLLVTVGNILELKRLERIIERLGEDGSREGCFGFIGASPAMTAVYRIIDSAASSKATVFITGESGVGKELCAEAVHRRGPRASGPFVAINCGAIPKDLIESEIFGHIKGAFTGAIGDRDGAATRADGGTLFLDEVCEMEPALQTKLLRFIQTGSFQRVGATRPETVDIRIICATNRDPLAEVREGRFREDLYYRLHVIPIPMPPLRERGEDCIEMARRFLVDFAREEGKRFRSFDAAAEAMIRAYPWPGNVRQLQNVVRNTVVLHDGEVVLAEMLPAPVGPGGDAAFRRAGEAPPAAALAIRPLAELERDAIERAVGLCDGNIQRAAGLLGVSPSTIYRKRLAWTDGPRSMPLRSSRR